MPCSAARRWEGIKQASPAQMTHDMALRPGPLFMASHVSKGLPPWGAPQPLPANLAQPSFSIHHTPKKKIQKIHTILSRNSGHRNAVACTHDWEVCTNQIDFLTDKFIQLYNINSWYTVAQEVKRQMWSATSEESTSCQATARPQPAHTAPFYQCLWCGRGCEIWREREEEIWCEDLNTFSL